MRKSLILIPTAALLLAGCGARSDEPKASAPKSDPALCVTVHDQQIVVCEVTTASGRDCTVATRSGSYDAGVGIRCDERTHEH